MSECKAVRPPREIDLSWGTIFALAFFTGCCSSTNVRDVEFQTSRTKVAVERSVQELKSVNLNLNRHLNAVNSQLIKLNIKIDGVHAQIYAINSVVRKHLKDKNEEQVVESSGHIQGAPKEPKG